MYEGQLPAASNRATWGETIQMFDSETSELIDISDATEVVIEVRDASSRCVVLTGSLTGGEVTMPSTGTLAWSFDVDTMRGIHPDTYEVGLTYTADGETVQVFIGTLIVLDGIVS